MTYSNLFKTILLSLQYALFRLKQMLLKIYLWAKECYQPLTSFQKLWIKIIMTIMSLMILLGFAFVIQQKLQKVVFQTPSTFKTSMIQPNDQRNMATQINPILLTNISDEKVKRNEKNDKSDMIEIPPQSSSTEQLNQITSQLNQLKDSLSMVASEQDVQQLQEILKTPNQTLLEKVNDLQNKVQTIIQQTAQKEFVDPATVERYFRLVAVQGFSDGMRAIIDVDGNQMTLDINEICPACRGWRLQSLDFTHQTAIFEKTEKTEKGEKNENAKQLYVKLQAQ